VIRLDDRHARRLRRLVAVGLAGALIVAGSAVPAGGAARSEGAAAEAAAPRFDGPTIFRGLYFGVGPAADLIPEQSDGLKTVPEVASIQRSVEARIARIDPGFFVRFGREMQSGDPVRVSRALEDSALLLKDALTAEAEAAGLDMNQLRAVTTGQFAMGVAAVAAAVVVVVVNWFWFWNLFGQSSAPSSLTRDVVSANLATALR
jgi:SdpC family antimicrobial peptide